MNKITLDDIYLQKYTIENLPALQKALQSYRKYTSGKIKAEVCIERAEYITEYLSKMSSATDSYAVRNAKAVKYFLENKKPMFFDTNLIAGSTSSKQCGAPVYPEFATGLTIWQELDSISSRDKNPLKLTKKDAKKLNLEIYPYWMKKSILEYTRYKHNNPKAMQLFERLAFYISGKAGCISHTVPHYETVLKKGLNGIITDIEKKLEPLKLKSKSKTIQKKIDFYTSAKISLQGIIAYATNLSLQAQKLASKTKDPSLKQQYLDIADVCANAPQFPAKTFREAINAIWIIQVAIHAENINMAMSPGRLDQILYPFYKRDIKDKKLTIAEAIELVGCLWIKLNDNTNLVPSTAEKLFGGASTVPAVTLGGIDKKGDDAVNDLTYIMLRATELLALRDPNVNARYNYKKNSKEYRNRVAAVIANTKAIPAMYNDIANIDTLHNQKEKLPHANDYAVIGCVELASNGRSYDSSSSIILNLVSALELTLYNGTRPATGSEQITPASGDPTTFTSFNQFWEAFKKQLAYLIDSAVELNEMFGHVYQEIYPSPLLSCFFEGPLQKGKDLIFGGATYNSSGATHIGFADVVDSLNAIEKAVFIDKKYSMQEILKALKTDFKNFSKLHAYLINRAPKYGTDDAMAKKNANNVIQFLYKTYQGYTNYRGGPYRPAFWTMTNHAGQGQLCGALPSGRKNQETLSSGITPCSQMSPILSECYRNVAALNTKHIPGGWALNLKHPPLNPENTDDIEKFVSSIEAYFREGGMQVQFNLYSYEQLVAALQLYEKDPTAFSDKHDFIVRVSGYSAYFSSLNEAMKQEIITRSEYNLKNQKLVIFPEQYSDMLPFK